MAEPLTGKVGGNDPGQQIAFWHQLADRPVTSNDEAFHGLLLFANGKDEADNYAGRVAALKGRGMLPASFDEPANLAVKRGTLAVGLARFLSIRGGVVMSILGLSPRYATRELVFLDLYPPSSPDQTFSGTEFLGIISKAEEYQQKSASPASGPGGMPIDTPAPQPQMRPAPSVQPAAAGT